MNEIKNYTERIFEDIKHIDEEGNEYWYARELMVTLDYKKWENFNKVIKDAMINCKNSGYGILDHFPDIRKIVNTGVSTKKIKDYKLSRYACYLIVQNGDSRKKCISLGKTYFAYQTRKMEILESEDEKRLNIRKRVKEGNLDLNKAAIKSGVKNLGRFHNAGYKGLYNGETADDIFKRKGLKYREDILDNMNSEELADNLFRIVQTDSKLKKEKVDNEYTANSIHYEIGKKVRNFIKELDGTMPEKLPMPDKSIKEIDDEATK